MLQTTKNQLNLKQIISKHRQLIIDELTNAGYNNIISDMNNENEDMIIYSVDSPISINLDLEQRTVLTSHYECIDIQNREIYCERFSTKDILMLINLYIHMIKNNIRKNPNVITECYGQTLKPGQLAEIISEYLTKEKN